MRFAEMPSDVFLAGLWRERKIIRKPEDIQVKLCANCLSLERSGIVLLVVKPMVLAGK